MSRVGAARKRNAVKILFKSFVVLVCVLCRLSQAQQEQRPLPAISSWASFSLGQVANSPVVLPGLNGDFSTNKEVLSGFDAGVRCVARISSHTTGRLHIGVSTFYDFSTDISLTATLMPPADLTLRRLGFRLMDATLASSWGLAANRDTIATEYGYFPYKYNSQAQDLGEYLFRSGTYPGTLYSGFETADKVGMCGAHLSYIWKGLGRLKQDLFFTIEMEQYPTHDFNLAYVATYSPAPPVEIGVGACLAHWFTLDERKETPWTDTTRFPASLRRAPTEYRWLAYVDPVTHDTTPYTFRGVKTMARITVDPIWFARQGSLFGKQDLKLYGEAAILGVQNYPGWYNDISQRVPVMCGINVPTFRLFDVLAVEAEYYKSPYVNSPYFVWTQRSPIPFLGSTNQPDINSWQPNTSDRWKWAVYGSRKITSRLRLSAQVASDHLSGMQFTGPPPSYIDYREVVPRTQDWYYMMRAMIYF